MVNLRRLWLQANLLHGAIPPEIGRLLLLKQLWLHQNRLEGPIPPEVAGLKEVEQLWLYQNELGGELPLVVGRFRTERGASVLLKRNRPFALAADVRQQQQMAEAQRTQYGRERDEWHKQEEALRAELAEARQRGGYREHVAAGGELRELGLNEEELRKIQSEVASQERLIAGYQTENERLTTQVRTLNERLRTEVGARDENVRRLYLGESFTL